jgi:hypothetical protein
VRLLVTTFIALAAAPCAAADVGVVLDRTSARPGDRIVATSSSCCFNSLYLVPARLVPAPRKCGSRAICTPSSVGPPRRPGWTWLGRFFPSRPSFAFLAAAPGDYRAVVYCPPCSRGPRGSLIAGQQVLRIR